MGAVLLALQVIANIGAVRKQAVDLRCIKLCNALGKRVVAGSPQVREAALAVLATVLLKEDPRSRIRSLALGAARSCAELPAFRSKIVELLREKGELLVEIFGEDDVLSRNQAYSVAELMQH